MFTLLSNSVFEWLHASTATLVQGSTNLIFACTDFRARKITRAYKKVTVGANLHR